MWFIDIKLPWNGMNEEEGVWFEAAFMFKAAFTLNGAKCEHLQQNYSHQIPKIFQNSFQM